MPEMFDQTQTYRFDEIADLVKDKIDKPANADADRYVGLEHIDPGSLKIRRWGETSEVKSSKLIFKSGDIIFGKRRAYQRKLAVADFDGICSAHAMVLRANPDVALDEFLPFFMQSDIFMDRAVMISVGGLSPTINWRALAKEEFAMPPLEEQQRIAEVLSAAEAVAESLRDLRQSLRTAEIGLLEDAMAGMPDNALVAVEELLREPPRNGVSPRTNSTGEGLKTVSISAVSDGLFNPTGCIKHAKIDADIVHQFFVKRGDAFVIRGNGNRQLCGKVGLSNNSQDELFYPDLLIRLRFDTSKILPQFAVAQWNLPSVHRRLSARAKSSNGIWKVNGHDIRAHSLFVPALAEQRRVVRNHASFRTNLENARAREVAARDIKKILLHSVWGLDG